LFLPNGLHKNKNTTQSRARFDSQPPGKAEELAPPFSDACIFFLPRRLPPERSKRITSTVIYHAVQADDRNENPCLFTSRLDHDRDPTQDRSAQRGRVKTLLCSSARPNRRDILPSRRNEAGLLDWSRPGPKEKHPPRNAFTARDEIGNDTSTTHLGCNSSHILAGARGEVIVRGGRNARHAAHREVLVLADQHVRRPEPVPAATPPHTTPSQVIANSH
jgi:hypothetical protein